MVACAECSTLPGQEAAPSAAHLEGCMAGNTIVKISEFKYYPIHDPTMKNNSNTATPCLHASL